MIFLSCLGRRHQLRIHCLCLGHPIVGDYTYNPWHRAAVLGEIDETNITTTSGDGDGNDHDRREMYYSSADRMMLHAYQLR